MSLTKHCDAFCPQMGLCANKNENECEGFIPMDSDEEEQNSLEEKLEQIIKIHERP